MFDRHRRIVPARSGHRPTTRTHFRDPLIFGNRRRRSRCHINNLTPLPAVFAGPAQRGLTGPAAIRMDLQPFIGIVGQTPRKRRRTRLLTRLAPGAGTRRTLLRRLLRPRRIRRRRARRVRRIRSPLTFQLTNPLRQRRNHALQLSKLGAQPSVLRTQRGIFRSKRSIGHERHPARSHRKINSTRRTPRQQLNSYAPKRTNYINRQLLHEFLDNTRVRLTIR